ncbi:FAD-dependent oxidoreductase [Streptomyces sp. NPDC002553]|uniref:NAD(P)/FAD-dependent oxidoreductase n=1 Tax=Streptomyces sp. NPDC002553 TaxID=3154417 RepID=UPI00331CA2D4
MSDGRATTDWPTVVVIGAGAAGLLAATALAEFAKVTLVERDRLPEGPEPRTGVPQAHHAHLVWAGGVQAFNDLLPGFVDEIVANGGRLVNIMASMVSRAPNEVWFPRYQSPRHYNLVCSRPLLDHVLRERVLKENQRITLLQETTVLGLEGTATAVTGVRVRTGETESVLHADLIVDSSGRGSSAATWLEQLGLPKANKKEINAGITYATRLYEAPGKTADIDFPLVNVQANPSKTPGQGGIILPIEGGRWIVTLSGSREGQPTRSPEQFIDFALGLGHPIIGNLLKTAVPLGGVRMSRTTANTRRYYEKMKAWPDGFIALGDSIAGTNPVYGHGLTVAAQCAIKVRDILRSTHVAAPGTARRLQQAAAGPVDVAWNLAVGQDIFYPGASDTSPTAAQKFLARFVDRCVATGARSPRALGALLDVMSLLRPPTRLFSMDMLWPMMFSRSKQPPAGPPLTEAEHRAALS